MYRRRNNGQISIAEFHLPFGGTLDPANRWIKLEELMPWEELEEAYAPQFNATIGAPAKPVRLAFGALYIKQRLGMTDEETVDQIRENPYIQFFLGLAASQPVVQGRLKVFPAHPWRLRRCLVCSRGMPLRDA